MSCPSCLYELARVRAAPDPHYGLSVVVCPRCARACVRTRHPDIEFWRGFRRVHHAMRMVFAKIAVVVVCAVVLSVLVMTSDQVFSPGGRFEPIGAIASGDPWLMIHAGGTLVAAIVSVMGVRLIMLHKHWAVPVVVLLLVWGVIVSSDWIYGGLAEMLGWIGGFDPQVSMPRTRELVGRLERMGLMAGFGILGLIPAWIVRGVVERAEHRRFRRVLRKRRKQRRHDD